MKLLSQTTNINPIFICNLFIILIHKSKKLIAFILANILLLSCSNKKDYIFDNSKCFNLSDFKIYKYSDSNYIIKFNDNFCASFIIEIDDIYIKIDSLRKIKVFNTNDTFRQDTIKLNFTKSYVVIKKNINIVSKNDNISVLNFIYFHPIRIIDYEIIISKNSGVIQINMNDGITKTIWKKYPFPNCNCIVIDSTFGYL